MDTQAPTNGPRLENYWMPFTANRQFKAAPRLLASAKGMHYTSADGRSVLDGTSGLWCVNLGHARQGITQAVERQLATLDYLLSDEVAKSLAAKIDLEKCIDQMPELSGAEHSDTVYICTVDKDRNAVSFINSLFHPYGAGLLEPSSCVLFHNRGQSFVIEDGHPNCISSNKRPSHTIIPGMVYDNGKPSLVFGVMGGHYQAMGHAYYLTRLFDHQLDLQQAMDEPRLFPLPGTNQVEAEERIRTIVATEFEKRGLIVQPPRWAIGGSQAISIDWQNGVVTGASDHRKDGCALGY